mmetsp:Transcript_26206/g.53150  ORF Transcript_26206/g.53150 Transcript_26206/m.53150 type:complete len:90 (-) Transcript_26206:1198-1467(-)
MVQVTLHAKAVNLARRMTVQNENDMMQESFVDDDDYDMPTKYSKEFCSELSKHLMHEKNLPKECVKFRDVVGDLKRRDTDTSHPTQWMS